MANESKTPYPVDLQVEYSESYSRWRALLGVIFFPKMILLIPHIFILTFLGIIAWVVMYIGYWIVLVTGKYPRGMFNYLVGVSRWSTRTDAWIMGLVDKYPPFSLQ